MNIIQDLNNGYKLNTVANKHRVLYKTIKTVRDRVLFHCKTRYTKNDSDINGIIIEKIDGEWKCVCFPLPAFRPAERIDRKIPYKIFDLYDGTVINVSYSFINEKWMISSRRSLDLSTETFRGYRYGDLITEFADVNYTQQLDKTKTYTYVFACPELHYMDRSLTLIGISQIGSAPEYKTPELNISLEVALAKRNVVLRSEGANYVILNDYTKSRNRKLFEVMLTKNRINHSDLKKRNMEKYFVEAKCYVYHKELELFNNHTASVIGCFEFLDKIREDIITYFLAKIDGKNIKCKSGSDMQIRFDIVFNKNSALFPKIADRLLVERIVDDLQLLLIYHDALLLIYGKK